jgi:hypothetical protein
MLGHVRDLGTGVQSDLLAERHGGLLEVFVEGAGRANWRVEVEKLKNVGHGGDAPLKYVLLLLLTNYFSIHCNNKPSMTAFETPATRTTWTSFSGGVLSHVHPRSRLHRLSRPCEASRSQGPSWLEVFMQSLSVVYLDLLLIGSRFLDFEAQGDQESLSARCDPSLSHQAGPSLQFRPPNTPRSVPPHLLSNS